MRTIAIESDTLSTGWTVVTARIPPRVCGAPNTAATERVKQVIASVDPTAFDPVPEAVAEAVVRDWPEPRGQGCKAAMAELLNGPPNCDGNQPIPRANFPPYVVDDTRDDDEGTEAEPARYPPGVACNVTGECE